MAGHWNCSVGSRCGQPPERHSSVGCRCRRSMSRVALAKAKHGQRSRRRSQAFRFVPAIVEKPPSFVGTACWCGSPGADEHQLRHRLRVRRSPIATRPVRGPSVELIASPADGHRPWRCRGLCAWTRAASKATAVAGCAGGAGAAGTSSGLAPRWTSGALEGPRLCALAVGRGFPVRRAVRAADSGTGRSLHSSPGPYSGAVVDDAYKR